MTDAHDRSAWLTRKAVATRLGLSVSSVRRLEGIELHPKRDSAGAWHFDPAEVEAHRARRGAANAAPPGPASGPSSPLVRLDGAIAAAIFADLAEGRSPVEIVIERELDPGLVALAVEQHARLERAALETRSGAERLEEIEIELASLRPLVGEVWRALLELNGTCAALGAMLARAEGRHPW